MEFTDKQFALIMDYREQNGHLEKDSDDLTMTWQDELQKSENGKILNTAYNVLMILLNDEKLKGKFAYNLLTNKPEIVGQVPWKRLGQTKDITDHDDSCLRNYLSINYGIKGNDIIYDSLNQILSDHKYHPVRDYLQSMRGKWDGIPRIDTLLIDYFDAEDTELNRFQTRLALAGAVKRAFEPGCKWDYVLTLKGEQGMGKSSFLELLSVNREWFSDSIEEIKGKETKEMIQGKWIIELGEMAAVSKGDQKRTKQFITSTHDDFRPAYGRRTVRYPRQCIFVATTNDELPLKDDTGGRRWWIIIVRSKWFEKAIPPDLCQIWAEAVHVYDIMTANNTPFKLPDFLENEARMIQTQNTDRGLYAGIIEDVLQKGYYEEHDYMSGLTKKVPINETCAFHVWEKVLKQHRDKFNSAHARDINAVLKTQEGWEQVPGRKKFGEYGKQTVYRRKDS